MLRHQQSEFLRSFFRLAWSRHHSLLLVSGACAAFYTQDLRAIDGFRTASGLKIMTRYRHRLNSFYRDQQQRPCRGEIVPEAWATTDAPTTPRTFIRQRCRWLVDLLKPCGRIVSISWQSLIRGCLGVFHFTY